MIESEIVERQTQDGALVMYNRSSAIGTRKVVYDGDEIILDVFGDGVVETQKLILCGTEKQVDDEIKRLNLKEPVSWV
jgi:hypothetical protein